MKKFQRSISSLQQTLTEAFRDETVQKEPVVVPRIFITSPSSDPLPLPGIGNQIQLSNDDYEEGESLDPPRNTIEERIRPDYSEDEATAQEGITYYAPEIDSSEKDDPKNTDPLIENLETVSCHSATAESNGDPERIQYHDALLSAEDNLSNVSHNSSLSDTGSRDARMYEWVDDAIYDDQLNSVAPPPDGGWGWMVLLGCCYLSTFLVSIASCFGILFRNVMLSMGVTSTNVSWILNVHIFLWNLCSVLTPPLCRHLGWRTVGITGSFILSVAFILMSLALSPLYIFVMFSLILGTTGGITSVICFMVLPAYFKKRRGMATTIFLAGISFGQMVVPLLISGLQAEYGFSGATLIHGGVLLNCCVACALFRPLRNIKVPVKRPTTPQDSGAPVENNGTSSVNIETCGPLLGTKGSPNNHLQRGGRRKPEKVDPPKEISRSLMSNIVKTTKENLRGINNVRMVLITLSMSCNIISLINFISFVPFAMTEVGFTMQEATFSVSVTGVGSIITRIIFSFIVDKKFVNRKLLYIVGIVSTSLCTFLFPLAMKNLNMLLATLVVWGVGMAISNSLFLVLLIDIIGMELYDSGVTVLCVMIAITSLVTGPAIGALRDLTSSYTSSIHACGALQLVAVLLVLALPCAPRPKKRYKVAPRRPGPRYRGRI